MIFKCWLLITVCLIGLSEEAEEKAIEEAEQKAESSYIKSSICDYWKGHKVEVIYDLSN